MQQPLSQAARTWWNVWRAADKAEFGGSDFAIARATLDLAELPAASVDDILEKLSAFAALLDIDLDARQEPGLTPRQNGRDELFRSIHRAVGHLRTEGHKVA